MNITLTNLLPINTTCNVTTRLVDILETNVDESYYLSEEKTRKLTLNEDLSGKLNQYDFAERDRIHSVNKVSPTLNTMQGGDRQPKVAISKNAPHPERKSFTSKKEYGRMGKQAIETMNKNTEYIKYGMTINAYNKTLDDTGLSPTLTTRPEGFKTAILPITKELRIRKLTPLECWRLQGFSDEQYYKAKNSGVSKSQLYKQAGNAVTVNVVDAIVGEIE